MKFCFVSAVGAQIAKYNSRQIFRLYGMLERVRGSIDNPSNVISATSTTNHVILIIREYTALYTETAR